MPSLLEGLVFCAPLDEPSTAAAAVPRRDVVSGLHLTDNNTVTSADGLHGRAGEFTAANAEFLSVPHSPYLRFTSYLSASAWMRRTIVINQTILGKWTYQTDGGWVLQTSNSVASSMMIAIATSAADGGTGCQLSFATGHVADVWYHVAFIFDGTKTGNADRLRFYQNGLLLTTTVVFGAVPATLLADGADLNVGKFGGTLTRYFNGRIAQPCLWRRPLAPAEIQHLYNGGLGRPYPF